MIGSLYTGITGMDTASLAMEVIGNNVANVNTTSFKSSVLTFETILGESMDGAQGNEVGTGAALDSLVTSWEQGGLNSSGNDTDLAITGDGFFGVENPGDNTLTYTRDGQFTWDSNGYLSSSEGNYVQGYDVSDGILPAVPGTDTATDINKDTMYTTLIGGTDDWDEVYVSNDGVVYGEEAGTAYPLFQMTLYTFKSNDGLQKLNGNQYAQTAASGSPSETISGASDLLTVDPYALEGSNVDLTEEFVRMIITQKAFEANSKVITTSAEMLDQIINLVR